MAFIEPMYRNKPNITYLLTWYWKTKFALKGFDHYDADMPFLSKGLTPFAASI